MTLSVTDPIGPAVGLFSEAFYADCCAALTDRGVLSAQAESPLFDREEVGAHLASPAQPFDQGDARIAGQNADQFLDAGSIEVDFVGRDHHGVINTDLVHLGEQFAGVFGRGPPSRLVVVVEMDVYVDQVLMAHE